MWLLWRVEGVDVASLERGGRDRCGISGEGRSEWMCVLWRGEGEMDVASLWLILALVLRKEGRWGVALVLGRWESETAVASRERGKRDSCGFSGEEKVRQLWLLWRGESGTAVASRKRGKRDSPGFSVKGKAGTAGWL